MKVTAIMATCGRHTCCERGLSLFLDQDYDRKHLLIYQNSSEYQRLDDLVDKKVVTLVNNHLELGTSRPYRSLGNIYADALTFVPGDTEVITFWDDDDLFLVNHLSEGINGLIRGRKTAYKPCESYFRSREGIQKASNVFEPSIFVKIAHIQKWGFRDSTIDHHLQWLSPLDSGNDIFIDPMGIPTLIYNWGDSFYSYKTSGGLDGPNNFEGYRTHSIDHGDRVISPVPDIFEKL